MNQIFAIAAGGALGAILRFLVSSGIYQWLGRGFPYGTLAVNIIGSFLLGLLTEGLVIQRIALGVDYRAAILIGFIGAFTTFSTFSLETLYLLEQGQTIKALGNIFISITACLLAVWLGLLCTRALFFWSEGAVVWQGHTFPYALLVINLIGAFLIGFITVMLLNKTALAEPYNAALIIITTGLFLVLSGLYLVLYLVEQGYSFSSQFTFLLGLFTANSMLCLLTMWLGYLTGKDI
jgi:fluoride exporter